MGNIIALINISSIQVEDDIFSSESEKELFLKSTLEEQKLFIINKIEEDLDYYIWITNKDVQIL
jgi:hypothetical protein